MRPDTSDSPPVCTSWCSQTFESHPNLIYPGISGHTVSTIVGFMHVVSCRGSVTNQRLAVYTPCRVVATARSSRVSINAGVVRIPRNTLYRPASRKASDRYPTRDLGGRGVERLAPEAWQRYHLRQQHPTPSHATPEVVALTTYAVYRSVGGAASTSLHLSRNPVDSVHPQSFVQ